jgi:hypothetical protein
VRLGARSALAALAATSCAGGAPLLHGAHTLGGGDTAQGAGFSGTFAVGDARAAVQSSEEGVHRAALDSLAPGVAPWVNARIGLGSENEAGITYTGRAVRFDARHAFEDESTAISIGAGASGVLRGDERTAPDGVTVAPAGFGFDVPILFGWRSSAGVVTLWAGARGGFEKVAANASPASEIDLKRFYGGGVFGFGLGFRHVHGVIELDGSYQNVSGSMGGGDVRFSGITLTPAAALVLTF